MTKYIRVLNVKTIGSTLILTALIGVFAFFGIRPDRYGSSSGGGTAAVVNGEIISVAEFRETLDMQERSSRFQLDQIPSEQREMYQAQIRSHVLEQMISGEVVAQSAENLGIRISDGEVRDYLWSIPQFQKNGRFQRELYQSFLENTRRNAQTFEDQIRKQMGVQKTQYLFSASMTPASKEVDAMEELNKKAVTLRILDVSPQALLVEKAVSEKEIGEYVKNTQNEANIKKYYDEHGPDYTVKEKVRARHILLRVDDKNPDAEVLARAKTLRSQLTPETFANVARTESKDTISAQKGGDLGFFERGKMTPEFENAAFSLKKGQISDPVKTPFGYHIIYVEDRTDPRTVSIEEARHDIAKKLLSAQKAPEAIQAITKALETGKVSEVTAMAKKYGVEWDKPIDVNLGSPSVPRVMNPQDILRAIARRQTRTGLIPELIKTGSNQFIVEITGSKTIDKTMDRETLATKISRQKSEDAFEGWFKDVRAKAKIIRSPTLFR